MATYAIGDVQGCFTQLQQLLALIMFDPGQDQLWFTGDLINRGPQSLETIRFVKNLGSRALTVLGNHDLHFIAVASNIEPARNKDTFQDILTASDLEEIVTWLRQQPLLYYDSRLKYALVHAGLAPQWTLTQALQYANEVTQALQSDNYKDYLANMYGNSPNQWQSELIGWERLRVITNYLTRMRYVDSEGRLELNYKGQVGNQPPGYYPWFESPNRANNEVNILFGHWASLQGKTNLPNVLGLDTGCCWGNCLTAFCLETQKIYQIDC